MSVCPYEALNHGVTWAIQQYPGLTIEQISEITGHTQDSVKLEIGYISKYNPFGSWVSESEDKIALDSSIKGIDPRVISAVGLRTFSYIAAERERQKKAIDEVVDSYNLDIDISKKLKIDLKKALQLKPMSDTFPKNKNSRLKLNTDKRVVKKIREV